MFLKILLDDLLLGKDGADSKLEWGSVKLIF